MNNVNNYYCAVFILTVVNHTGILCEGRSEIVRIDDQANSRR